jgi:hypothetical protein
MNLSKIIDESGLRIDYVAARLFPGNKHPYNALNRVLARGGTLDADQLRVLAILTGRTTDDLLGLSWSGKIDASGITLAKGELRVSYTPGAGFFTITSATSLGVVDLGSYVIDEEATTVRAFLALVETAIDKLT